MKTMIQRITSLLSVGAMLSVMTISLLYPHINEQLAYFGYTGLIVFAFAEYIMQEKITFIFTLLIIGVMITPMVPIYWWEGYGFTREEIMSFYCTDGNFAPPFTQFGAKGYIIWSIIIPFFIFFLGFKINKIIAEEK